jgi:RNA polymerase sigma-70 factor, ECF subfamily
VACSLVALRTVMGQDRPSLSGNADRSPQCVPAHRYDLLCYQRVVDLYDQLQPLLLAHLRGLGLTREDAEDVTHESFLRLLRHLLEARADENLRGWVFRVAYNLSMDVHRSNRHYQQGLHLEMGCGSLNSQDAADPDPSPEDVVIRDERFHRLQKAVLQLTVQQRNCLLLRAEGLRYREIALRLGISVQRVAKLLERSTSHLAASL